jgi:hypothetical protein
MRRFYCKQKAKVNMLELCGPIAVQPLNQPASTEV